MVCSFVCIPMRYSNSFSELLVHSVYLYFTNQIKKKLQYKFFSIRGQHLNQTSDSSACKVCRYAGSLFRFSIVHGEEETTSATVLPASSFVRLQFNYRSIRLWRRRRKTRPVSSTICQRRACSVRATRLLLPYKQPVSLTSYSWRECSMSR